MPGWKNDVKDGLSGKRADYILCPLFHAHSEKSILCEGEVPETRTEIKFKGVSQKCQQQKIFCEGCYQKCEHYIAVKHFRWEDDK